MHWILSAPFITTDGGKWLEPFVPGTRHGFCTVPAQYDHDRSRPETNANQWRDYFSHGAAAWSARKKSPINTGVITLFPQLALMVGLHKRFSHRPTPLVAWTFNLGNLYHGTKGQLARFALREVDRFIVHSTKEISSYSDWLDLSPQKFRFVPLQRPLLPIQFAEDTEQPFVLSMGSAQRDYRLFFEVMEGLGYPTMVVAGAQALAGLKVPANVTVHNNLDINRCHEMVQKARINVVPIDNQNTASGQVTLIDSMMFGRPTVATRSIGTEDYVKDGTTALLVETHDHESLLAAIQSLWDDKSRRISLGDAARQYVEQTLSDEAAGRTLSMVLDEMEDQYART